jgi:hypothetical protein
MPSGGGAPVAMANRRQRLGRPWWSRCGSGRRDAKRQTGAEWPWLAGGNGRLEAVVATRARIRAGEQRQLEQAAHTLDLGGKIALTRGAVEGEETLRRGFHW